MAEGLENIVGDDFYQKIQEVQTELAAHLPINPETDKLKQTVETLIAAAGQEYLTTKKEADTDPLTNLLNRRAMKEAFQSWIDKNASTDENQTDRTLFQDDIYTILMVDGDKFKRINDVSYSTGDAAIKGIADLIKSAVRSYDKKSVSRHGGEEYIVVLYGVSKERGKRVAQRINESIRSDLKQKVVEYLEENNLEYAKKKLKEAKFSVSIGVAEGNIDQDVKEVIALAHKSLAQAKKYGRNMVVVDNENPEDKLSYAQKKGFEVLGIASSVISKMSSFIDTLSSLYSEKCCPNLRS